MAQNSPYSSPQPETYDKQSLPPHEIVTSCPMNLNEGTHESSLLKGDILHYYQGLINQLIGMDKLLTFHSVFLENKDLKDHNLQALDFCPLERTLKTLSPKCWEGPFSGV